MHHFLYPSQNAYISSNTNDQNENFGLNELLKIGVNHNYSQAQNPTTTYNYNNQFVAGMAFQDLTAVFTGSFFGNIYNSTGSIIGTSTQFTTSYFSGSISGSISGSNTGSFITSSNFSGSLIGFSGSINSDIINGYVSSSIITNCFSNFTGTITSSAGNATGYVTGYDIENQTNISTIYQQYINRTLIQFDLSFISQSITNGSINSPSFYLKLKSVKEKDLPTMYTIYAFPISQSWNQGNGYWSDGGSNEGVSWNWKDFNSGSAWFSPYVTYPLTASVDYLNNYAFVSQSFERGGGTWYNLPCTQSFDYQKSDINLNVTPIVSSWLSGSILNNGFILMISEETNVSSSDANLEFYSKHTNTIYSPKLDVAWDDSVFITGSIFTSSVIISTINSGITASIQTGSTINYIGGINGIFNGNSILNIVSNYITNSNFNFTGYTVQQFTGSLVSSSINLSASIVSGSINTGSGDFFIGYFSGSVGGIPTLTSSAEISGSLINGILSGSMSTVQLTSGFNGTVTSSNITIFGSGSGYYLDTTYNYFSGFVIGNGITGSIEGDSVIGAVSGLITITQSIISPMCQPSFTANEVTGSIITGNFSGSNFTSYYVNYTFQNAILTGSWINSNLYGDFVNIPIPSSIFPYYYAYISGSYINGTAIGTYSILNNNSASFNGQFINGDTMGGKVNLQLSGSVYTSSLIYTSSVNYTSSVIYPLDTTNPFVVIIQNLRKEYSFGDIPKIKIFGREQFPIKTFIRTPQQVSYITPSYLPTSSFYSIKDNETEEVIVDSDIYTKLSCDESGNYFNLDTTGLVQERYYRILILIDNPYGNNYTFDSSNIFKIIR